jgi:hypothetical protein
MTRQEVKPQPSAEIQSKAAAFLPGEMALALHDNLASPRHLTLKTHPKGAKISPAIAPITSFRKRHVICSSPQHHYPQIGYPGMGHFTPGTGRKKEFFNG